MKKLSLFLVVVFTCLTGVQASQPFDDLAKLIKSGAAEEVVIAYINACGSDYNLSSDEIVQLKESGASPKIVIIAIQHKGKAIEGSTSRAAETDSAALETQSPLPEYRAIRVMRPRRMAFWLDPAIAKMNQAIQINLAGVAFGTLSLNYEYLLKHQHGFVVEGTYFEDGDAHGENAGLSYRWHWSRSMYSGFVGLFVNGGRSHGTKHDVWSGITDTYSLTRVTVGPNIGARWVLPYGLSVVARVGYGHTWMNFDNSNPSQSTIDQLKRDASLDSELSLGCAF